MNSVLFGIYGTDSRLPACCRRSLNLQTKTALHLQSGRFLKGARDRYQTIPSEA
ncbi:hypothetical protein SynMITS9220_02937 [Synechococcus sp. MIT S9220]|nr:hypothetical protein SynMITS9220_02937 [Synechococcus sp. MIT S9220]